MVPGLNPLRPPRFFVPGDRLGSYELIRRIAVGPIAELYLGRTSGLGGLEKLVVVKRILPHLAQDPGFVTTFMTEARLAATLHHPNIVQVVDLGHDATDYFVSMEYVHGEDLGRLLVASVEQGIPISLDCALTLVVGVCAGLHHAHERIGPDGQPIGVVHRDVSPSNILVSYDGAVKLGDFCIGGLEGAWSGADRRADLFGVGAILYELTTGRPLARDDVRPPSYFVPGYSPALEAIVMKALARDPDERYRTAHELGRELEGFAHDHRLRITPLALNRFMSALFPGRHEEWAHAQAQGAFFVEQHVVRTLIESGKITDPTPAFVEPATALGEEAPTRIRGSMAPHAMSAPRATPMPPPAMAVPPHGSGPKPLPTHQPNPDYVADHTELVRPIKPRRARTDRPDLAARPKPPTSWKLPLAAASIGVIGIVIALVAVMRNRDAPASPADDKSIVDVEDVPLAAPPVVAPSAAPVVVTPPTAAPVPPPAEPPPTIVEPEPPAPVVVAQPIEPAPTAVPTRPKRPATKKAPAIKPEKKPVKADPPPASEDKVDTSKPWSKDSPFMPVRPVKKSK